MVYFLNPIPRCQLQLPHLLRVRLRVCSNATEPRLVRRRRDALVGDVGGCALEPGGCALDVVLTMMTFALTISSVGNESNSFADRSPRYRV